MRGISDRSNTLSPNVHVRLWELGEYQSPETGVPSLVDPAWVKGQLARSTISIGHDKAKVWATIDLAKVCYVDMFRNTYILTLSCSNFRTSCLLMCTVRGRELQMDSIHIAWDAEEPSTNSLVSSVSPSPCLSLCQASNSSR